MRESLATPELRAFQVFDRLPSGHTLHLVRDDRHAPHLQPGEFAVVDTTDRDVQFGEVYLLQQSTRAALWQVAREPEKMRQHRIEPDRPCAMLLPLNRPELKSDGSVDWSRPVHCGDGPILLDAVARDCIGRVVGIFQAPELPTLEGRHG